MRKLSYRLTFLILLAVLIFPREVSAFSFVAWGDTKSAVGTLASLSKQAKTLNPNFTLYAGDLQDAFSLGGLDIWKNAMNGGVGNGMFDITFPIRGNHDDGSTTSWQGYFNTASKVTNIGGTNYSYLSDDLTFSFDYGNSRFIGVDVPGDAGVLASAQITWIDQRLTDAESKGLTHAFIFFHGPLYCADGHCSCDTVQGCIASTTNSLLSVISKHPIVTATFHGHEHIMAYAHLDSSRIPTFTRPGGLEHFIIGDAGAGPSLVKTSRTSYYMYFEKTTTFTDQRGGFLLVDVSGGTVTAKFYRGTVTTPEKIFTFTKGTPPTVKPTTSVTVTTKPTNTLTPRPTASATVTPGIKPGDVNRDGKVDILDFQLLSNSFGKSSGQTGYNANADFIKDGKVDILDFQVLSNNFGK